MCMIDVLKIHAKPLRYTTGKLTEAWRTPIFYDSSVGSRDGHRPQPTSMVVWLLFIVAGFAFTSRLYISAPSDECFWNVNGNKRYFHGSKRPQ